MANEIMDLDRLIGWDGLITEEERMVRQTVRRFVQDSCMPRIVDAFEKGYFPRELLHEFAQLGLYHGVAAKAGATADAEREARPRAGRG